MGWRIPENGERSNKKIHSLETCRMGRATQGEKEEVLKELREKGFKLNYLLKAVNMAKSIYYFEIRKKDVVAEKNQVLTQKIQEIFTEN